MTKIIADVGSNWFTFEDCLESIEACPADAVKFQYFTSLKMYGKSDYFLKELPKEWIPHLAAKCKALGKEFMCTVFHHSDVAMIDEYVSTHKISSAEITDLNLLKATAATDKPALISTGCAGKQEITAAIALFKKEHVTLLYCEAEYPSRYHNLSNISLMRNNYGVPIGYSDHSLDVYASPSEAAFGCRATVIEKHFGLERILHTRLTADHGHSLNELDFGKMCDLLRSGKYTREYPTHFRRVKRGNDWVRPR